MKVTKAKNIRGLAPQVMELMSLSATNNDRSLEGEFRHAVEQYVAPLRRQHEYSARRSGLAERLRLAHLTFLERHPDHSQKLSYLAQAIGEERAGDLETWFNEGKNAPFSSLEKLAKYLGCSVPWLIHGDGTIDDVNDPSDVQGKMNILPPEMRTAELERALAKYPEQ